MSFWVTQKHEKTPFGFSESLRSTKKLHLVFLSHSEARKSSIWSFWVTQKHEKTPFGLSESLRSTKKLHLVFLSRSEARKKSICPFWVAQKHEKSPFGLSESLRSIEIYFFHTYVVDRNDYFLFFMLMSLTETPIFSFSRLCRWQKRLFSLFCAYVVVRNTYFLFFMLMSLTEAIIFSFSRLCRWQKRLFFSICSFWNVQKHKNSPFALSETFRSMKTRKLFARLPYNLYFCMQMKIYLT